VPAYTATTRQLGCSVTATLALSSENNSCARRRTGPRLCASRGRFRLLGINDTYCSITKLTQLHADSAVLEGERCRVSGPETSAETVQPIAEKVQSNLRPYRCHRRRRANWDHQRVILIWTSGMRTDSNNGYYHYHYYATPQYRCRDAGKIDKTRLPTLTKLRRVDGA
jgi:hypothetical protein